MLLAFLPLAQAGGGGGALSGCGFTPRMDLAGIQRLLTAAEVLWQRRRLKYYSISTAVTGQLEFGVVVAVHEDRTVRGQIIQIPVK